jgi:1-deoxy-D-xylulose-5-phosphate synthase
VAIYSTFLQRAFDQLIHDVALQHLHVVFASTGAGLSGADGPTHHGVFDLSYLRMIPGMAIMAPKDESELRDMLYTAVQHEGGPIALRYPRGNGVGVPMKEGFDLISFGKGETLRTGRDVALLAIGTMTNVALKAAELLAHAGIAAEVVNMRFVKPLDTDLLREVALRIPRLVTLEDNVLIGGFGSAVAEFLAADGIAGVRLLSLGIPDRFIDHGTPQDLQAELGLDPPGVARSVTAFLAGNRRNAS